MDQWEGRTHPYPVPGSCDADGLRASQLQHAVQSMDGNLHLDRSTLVCAAAQPVTDHLFEPAHGGFDAGSDGRAVVVTSVDRHRRAARAFVYTPTP